MLLLLVIYMGKDNLVEFLKEVDPKGFNKPKKVKDNNSLLNFLKKIAPNKFKQNETSTTKK